VKASAGNIQSLRRGGVVENREDSFDRLHQVWAYPAPINAFIEPLQTPVLEAPDPQGIAVNQILSVVRCQLHRDGKN
jgi:hypothetical protein